MTIAKFRIPDVNLYLGTDGMISPKRGRGERATPLGKDNIQMVGATYLGHSLQRMTVREYTSGGKSDPGEELMGSIIDFFDLLTLGVDYIDFAKKLNDWITGN
jgi:hypothetical protein